MKLVLLTCVTFCLFFPAISNGSKILVLLPFPGPSHWHYMKHFIRELVNRGHEVTAITNFEFGEKLPNYTEIMIKNQYPILEKHPIKDMYNMKLQSPFFNIFFLYNMGLETSRYGLEDENVKTFIESEDQQFDLIFAEQFYQESWLMFAHKFNAPIITIATLGFSDFMDRAMGLWTPWSMVPHYILSYEDDMTFCQRVNNALMSMFDAIYRLNLYLPYHDKLAKKHFASIEKKNGPLPSVSDLEKSISVILANTHDSISRPRPTMPGQISIAGAHIQTPKALPTDIQQFIDGAQDGVVYFSLGAFMKSSEMPEETLRLMLNIFSKLKQRVLWKFENESLENVPKNVMIKKWMPQNDVLANDKVVLFISHGGMFGTFEGIYWGRPSLFIPFYGDQNRNSMKAEQRGYALRLRFSEITEENFNGKIVELIDNKKYAEKAKELSTLLRDNPIHPMDEATYWIEYVLKYKGAKHLKSRAVNMNFFEYTMLDVFTFLFLCLAISIYILVKIVKFLCCRRKVANKEKKQ